MPAADALAALDAVPVEQVPAAILRLTGRLVATAPRAREPADDLPTVDDVAKMLHADRRWVWRAKFSRDERGSNPCG